MPSFSWAIFFINFQHFQKILFFKEHSLLIIKHLCYNLLNLHYIDDNVGGELCLGIKLAKRNWFLQLNKKSILLFSSL